MLASPDHRPPDDWPLWLVYADLLLEQGDERGVLIGIEHRVATAADEDERHALRVQARALLDKNTRAWSIQSARELLLVWRFGFVVGARGAGDQLRNLSRCFAHPNARFLVKLTVGRMSARTLAASDALGRLLQLDLDDPNLGDAAAITLIEGGKLGSLIELGLGNSSITSATAIACATAESLRGLTRLYLQGNAVGHDGVDAIARSRTLLGLRELNLGRNRLTDEDMYLLADAEPLSGLERLYLSGNPIGDDGARALAASPALRSLRALFLKDSRLGPEGRALLTEVFGSRGCDVRV